MALFGKKKIRVIRIPGTTSISRTTKVKNPPTTYSPPTTHTSCGGSCQEVTPVVHPELMRTALQPLSAQNGYAATLPKQGVIEFEWYNSDFDPMDIIIFDALGVVQKAMGKPSLPVGVTRTSIRKDYQDVISAVIAGESYMMSKMEYTVSEGSGAQTSNPLFAHVGNHFTDEQTQIGEVTPVHHIDRGNQRHLDYASIPASFWVDPRFALVHRLEGKTRIRIRFVLGNMVGSDR